MPGEIVDFILKLVALAGKLPVQVGLPQAVTTILPPLATAGQLLVAFVRTTAREHSKKVLREKVVSLRAFVSSFPAADLSRDDQQALLDADTERQRAVAELARMAATAAAAAAAAARPRSRLRQTFLLYTPQPRWLVILHTLFYMCVLELAFIAVFLALSFDDVETRFALLVSLMMFTLVAAVTWGLSTDLDRDAGGRRNLLQRGLLAHRPARPSMWLVHILFWFLFTGMTVLVMLLLQAAAQGESLDGWFEGSLVAVVTIMCWSFATDVDRRRDGSPNIGRRLFLFYAPDRRVLWALHVLFYAFALAAVTGTSDVLRGRTEYDPASFALVPILFCASVAWVIRDVAVGREPWSGGIPRRIAWLKIGRLPRNWPRGVLFVLCGLLFYVSVCLWPVLAFDLVRTDEGFGLDFSYLFRVVLPAATIGFAARWCARKVQEPRAAPPELV